jgi:hypothetical protein
MNSAENVVVFNLISLQISLFSKSFQCRSQALVSRQRVCQIIAILQIKAIFLT